MEPKVFEMHDILNLIAIDQDIYANTSPDAVGQTVYMKYDRYAADMILKDDKIMVLEMKIHELEEKITLKYIKE